MAAAEAVARRMVDEARANAEARRAHAGRYLLHTLAKCATHRARRRRRRASVVAFRNMPAVIVGAGPSLDDALNGLNAIRDRALIMGCDTAARPLLASGVSPHFIVALDPSESTSAIAPDHSRPVGVRARTRPTSRRR